MSSLKSTLLIVVGMSVLLIMGCGDPSIPSGPTTVVTPTPTPAPTPEATPTPSPYVAPHHSLLTCETEEKWLYKKVLIEAQERLRENKPEWFDYDTLPGWILVTKPARYFEMILDYIDDVPGYKAAPHFYEPETHIAIKAEKDSNQFSETYQIITSFRGISTGYAFTCKPAEF